MSKPIKSIQVIGCMSSSVFYEIKQKLNELTNYLQHKKQFQKYFSTNVIFVELNETDFIQKLTEQSKQFTLLFQISEQHKNQKAYMIINNEEIIFDINSFHKSQPQFQQFMRNLPLNSEEQKLDFQNLANQEYIKKIQNYISTKVSTGQSIFSYLCIEANLDDGQQKKINLVVELNNQLCPLTSQNFTALLNGNTSNKQGEKLSYIYTKLNVKRSEFLQGGKLKVQGERTIHGQYFLDENFTLVANKAGVLASVNDGIRDSNNSQFFITLEDMSRTNLNNMCFGEIIFGLENLLELTNVTTDSETLDWQIIKGGDYQFDKRDFTQINGVTQFKQDILIPDSLNLRLQELKQKQQQEEQVKSEILKQQEIINQQQAEEKFKSDKHQYQKHLIQERKKLQKSVSVNKSKHEFQVTKQLQNDIIHHKDSEKQQSIDQYADEMINIKTKYQLELEQGYEELMKLHLSDMEKYNVQFPKEDEEQTYKLNVRVDEPPKPKVQDQDIFKVVIAPKKIPVIEKTEEETQQNQEEENQEQQQEQEKQEEEVQPEVESDLDFEWEDIKTLYTEYNIIQDYLLNGNESRILIIQDQNTKQRILIKQYRKQQKYNEAKELNEQLQTLSQEKSEIQEYFTQVIKFNDEKLIIEFDNGQINLEDFTKQLGNRQMFYFQERQKKQLNQLITQLYKMMNTLISNKIYVAPTFSLQNLVLDYSQDYIDLKVKIVDYTALDINSFENQKQIIPAFNSPEVFEQDFQSEDERIINEFYILGRLLAQLINNSINLYEDDKAKYTQNQFMVKYTTFFEVNSMDNNKALIEKFKAYFDGFHIDILQSLLIDKSKDKVKKLMDQLRKDAKNAVYNIYDFDDLITYYQQNLIETSYDSEQKFLTYLQHLNKLEYYDRLLKDFKYIQKYQFQSIQFQPQFVYLKMKAYHQLGWQTKIAKFTELLEKNNFFSDLEKKDELLFHQIYLMTLRAKYSDIEKEENLNKIQSYLESYQNFYLKKYGENSVDYVQCLLNSGELLKKIIGKAANATIQILSFRQNYDQIEKIVKQGIKLTPYQQAQNLLLSTYGYANANEDQNLELQKKNEEALEILKNNNLIRNQLYCDILENVNAFSFLQHNDTDIFIKNQKVLALALQRAHKTLTYQYLDTMQAILQSLSKNRQKLHITQFEITDLLQNCCLTIVKCKLPEDLITKYELHTLRGACNQENYNNHLKDYLNKALEYEQQWKFKKTLQTYKAAQHLNNLNLQEKKDFSDNQEFISQRIQIIRQKKRIFLYRGQLSDQIKIDMLQKFVTEFEEKWSIMDTYFYLIQIYPAYTKFREEKYQQYTLEVHRQRPQLEKMKTEIKKYAYEYGILNYYLAFCHFKMHQRYIMSYYLYVIDENTGQELPNSAIHRKKNTVIPPTIERFEQTAQVLITVPFKPEQPKFTYLVI